MKFKAIIFDLDGTAIPNRRDGMPSPRLISVIEKLKDKIHISAATGRGLALGGHILKELKLTDPCIISGGTKIIDPVSEKILWEKKISEEQVREILKIAAKYPYKMFFGNATEAVLAKDKVVDGPENIIYIEPVPPKDTEEILRELKTLPNIVAHTVLSWSKGDLDIHITHAEATKKHAVEVLRELLGVKKEEIAGFGDSNNDLPIFEGVGYKVAMSNGSEDLKKAADMIAPHAEADGLAEILEKIFEV